MRSLAILILLVVGVALVPFFGLTGCGLLEPCSDATSSLKECEECVGVEYRADGSKWIPCGSFKFEVNKTCQCK
jgi:hypothetical protein